MTSVGIEPTTSGLDLPLPVTAVDLIRRSWVRFPPRSKDFFFTSCGYLIPFSRVNAQWVIHGFNKHLNLHFRVNSLFHHLCSQCYVAQHSYESKECTRAEWLKIVFLQLDGDTELARAVDVVMARAKRIYILIIKVNKLFSFFWRGSCSHSISRSSKLPLVFL